MKNWKILLNTMLISFGIIYFSGCDSGGEVTIQDPTASLSGTDISQTLFEPGEMIDLTLSFTAPQGVSGINWQFFDSDGNAIGEKEFNNPDSDPDLESITSADTQGEVELSIPVPDLTQGESLSLVFEVLDKSSGNDATTSFTFNVETGIEEYETVLLGGYSNATDGSFYNSAENVVYKYQEATTNDNNIDLLFYFVNSAGLMNVIASPDNEEAQISWESQQSDLAWPFSTENSTRFKSLGSSFDFEGTSTSIELENAYPETGTEEERITELQVGQVVAFVLDGSRGARYGIFEIAAIGGSSGADRSITLNVKVQSANN